MSYYPMDSFDWCNQQILETGFIASPCEATVNAPTSYSSFGYITPDSDSFLVPDSTIGIQETNPKISSSESRTDSRSEDDETSMFGAGGKRYPGPYHGPGRDPAKKRRTESQHNPGLLQKPASSSTLNFQQPQAAAELDSEAITDIKEMIYFSAMYRPVNMGVETVEKLKRKNVRFSKDPVTVAARARRERVSARIRVLRRMIPGGNRMDTASMLEEAANYLKFLRSQLKALEDLGKNGVDGPAANENLVFAPFPNNFNY